MRLNFHRLSRKEAWEPQALIFHLWTHPFPHFTGAAIPFQTLFPFTGKLHSTFFWGKAELTAELGAEAQCSTVQMLEHVPPYRAVHTRPTMQSSTGTQLHGAPTLGTAPTSQGYVPAKEPLDITEYRAPSKILKTSSRKEERRPDQSTPLFLHRRHSRITH